MGEGGREYLSEYQKTPFLKQRQEESSLLQIHQAESK